MKNAKRTEKRPEKAKKAPETEPETDQKAPDRLAEDQGGDDQLAEDQGPEDQGDGPELATAESAPPLGVLPDAAPPPAPRGRPRLSESDKRRRRDEARARALEARRLDEERARAVVEEQARAVTSALVDASAAIVAGLIPPPLTADEKAALTGAWTPVLGEYMGATMTPVQAALVISLAIIGPRIALKFLAGSQAADRMLPAIPYPPRPPVAPAPAPEASGS